MKLSPIELLEFTEQFAGHALSSLGLQHAQELAEVEAEMQAEIDRLRTERDAFAAEAGHLRPVVSAARVWYSALGRGAATPEREALIVAIGRHAAASQ